ncbi:MAG: hypothetical protein BGP24_03905 [Lysobacterales bacterium 69-70]|nr:hypothetical protein [Xanthomonadaceae bacterium]ODU32306.1 MAG: hypothetical protein ABS97_18170 [Xanthomonadaceae bacterium SCN 69-320]ODV19067.1 MAG: hypothetical protein ABT27_12315 [Xanthomonadaceae bacterium SCN 69-25]OJZ02032.1 MAG: hypothetical protein BGP24_03905 [Xanthomonadales bacterium 69-70]
MEDYRHSGLGIASFILSLVAALCLFALFGVAGYLEISTPGGVSEESPLAVGIGLLLFLFLGLAFVALCLGIAGLVEKRRRRILAGLGTLFSAFALISAIAVMLIGLTMGK